MQGLTLQVNLRLVRSLLWQRNCYLSFTFRQTYYNWRNRLRASLGKHTPETQQHFQSFLVVPISYRSFHVLNLTFNNIESQKPNEFFFLANICAAVCVKLFILSHYPRSSRLQNFQIHCHHRIKFASTMIARICNQTRI